MKNFKHLPILLVLATMCCWLVSCSSDDDDTNESLLIGTWTFQSANVDFTIDGESYIDFLINSLDLTEEEAQELLSLFEGEEDILIAESGTLVFNSDGTYTVDDDLGSDSGTWSVNADNTILTFDSGTTDEQETTILTLTESRLVIAVVEEETDDFDLDGDNETLRIELSLTLTR